MLFILGLSLGVVLGLIVVCIGILVIIAKRKRRLNPNTPANRDLNHNTPSNQVQEQIVALTSDTHTSSFATAYYGLEELSHDNLVEATDNFDQSRKLRQNNAYAASYLGRLNNGLEVIITKAICLHAVDFISELDKLARLRHKNLVTLFGYTTSSRGRNETFLVYEYDITNISLANYLHGDLSSSCPLSWPVRVEFAIQIAEALCFLHQHEVIHRNLTTKNILLNNSGIVKVADSGLDKLLHPSVLPGTCGYIDPVYLLRGYLTKKSDVFSFGAVLVELISSKKALDSSRRPAFLLREIAIDRIERDVLHEFVDPNLGYAENSLFNKTINWVAQLALECLKHDREMRPSMDQVKEALEEIHTQLSAETNPPYSEPGSSEYVVV